MTPGCLCVYGGDPSNLGRPQLALYPQSLGSALVLTLTDCLTSLGLSLLIYKMEYIASTL